MCDCKSKPVPEVLTAEDRANADLCAQCNAHHCHECRTSGGTIWSDVFCSEECENANDVMSSLRGKADGA